MTWIYTAIAISIVSVLTYAAFKEIFKSRNDDDHYNFN